MKQLYQPAGVPASSSEACIIECVIPVLVSWNGIAVNHCLLIPACRPCACVLQMSLHLSMLSDDLVNGGLLVWSFLLLCEHLSAYAVGCKLIVAAVFPVPQPFVKLHVTNCMSHWVSFFFSFIAVLYFSALMPLAWQCEGQLTAGLLQVCSNNPRRFCLGILVWQITAE